MSLLVPLVSSGITMNEVPGEITCYFEIGECTQDCPGCHSPHLREQCIPRTSLDDMEYGARCAKKRGASAIAVMGGTTNGIPDADLIKILKRLGRILPVCLYSGSDDLEHDRSIAQQSGLQWLKTGSYQEARGGLSTPGTNQRFYRCEPHYIYTIGGCYVGTYIDLIDHTHWFQHQKGDT